MLKTLMPMGITWSNGIMEGIDGMLGMDLYFRSRGYGTGNIADDMNFYTWALST